MAKGNVVHVGRSGVWLQWGQDKTRRRGRILSVIARGNRNHVRGAYCQCRNAEGDARLVGRNYREWRYDNVGRCA